jgi:ankyrin repeat protein
MKRVRSVPLWVCLTIASGVWSARPAAAAPRAGKLGPDLFLAVGRKDLRTVKGLLRRGADPNARNFLAATPLMLTALTGDAQSAQALLAAGAEVEATSQFGTALTFAEMSGNAAMARLLLAHGAKVTAQRVDGITVLMLAARSGHTQVIEQLLAKKASFNASDKDGMTALMYATRAGQPEAASLLVRRGADVKAADSHRWTALTFAAAGGHAGIARLLLQHGADANTRDEKGRTPLMIAATYGDHPETLRALLDGGADLQAKDSRNRTALALAVSHGKAAAARFLLDRGAEPLTQPVTAQERSPRAAIASSLPALERSMRLFARRTACVSCHHEGLGRMATGLARQRGVTVDAALARAQAQRIAGMLAFERPLVRSALKDIRNTKNVPTAQIGDLVPFYAYTFAGIEAHRQPADATLSEAALFLARQQERDGHWHFWIHRGQMQTSYIALTALALRAMQTYAPKSHAAEIDWRTRRARAWLLTARPETTQDKAFRLLGLKWAGASLQERGPALEALRREQRADGGWAGRSSGRSDAYATGQALFALHQGGALPVADPVYQRGVQFLLQSQEEDGSWFVTKEAMPANNYFDAGFPHGQSQYISHAGTAWATMALLLTIDRPGGHPQTATR